jgi:hypothetical protein
MPPFLGEVELVELICSVLTTLESIGGLTLTLLGFPYKIELKLGPPTSAIKAASQYLYLNVM